MNLGDKIRALREELGLTQGQLANNASLSQGYLSQLENGDVKSPSAAVLLRVAQAMQVDPDELFEAAGYPTVRKLREVYRSYESTIDPDLLRYLGHLPRDRQRRLLLLLEGMENLLGHRDEKGGKGLQWAEEKPKIGHGGEEQQPHSVHLSRLEN